MTATHIADDFLAGSTGCGRTITGTMNVSKDKAEVTCKTCKRSDAYRYGPTVTSPQLEDTKCPTHGWTHKFKTCEEVKEREAGESAEDAIAQAAASILDAVMDAKTCGAYNAKYDATCDEPAGDDHPAIRDGRLHHGGTARKPEYHDGRLHWLEPEAQQPSSSSSAFARLVQLAERVGQVHTVELNRLDTLSDLIEQAEMLRTRAVDRAREHGYSWTEIGQNIGCTKQAAQQRYGKKAATNVDDRQGVLL